MYLYKSMRVARHLCPHFPKAGGDHVKTVVPQSHFYAPDAPVECDASLNCEKYPCRPLVEDDRKQTSMVSNPSKTPIQL